MKQLITIFQKNILQTFSSLLLTIMCLIKATGNNVDRMSSIILVQNGLEIWWRELLLIISRY